MSEIINNEEVVNEQETVEVPENKPETKTFTQEEVNKLLAERVARANKKIEKFADYDELKTKLAEYTKAEEERKQSEMSEVEKLQAQLQKFEQQAKEAEETKLKTLESANKRLIKSEFKVLAKDLGVRKDALDDAFVLADMSSVEIDDEGNVTGVKEALESLKKAKAYLFGVTEYADPSPGQHETKRDNAQEQSRRKLQELADKAKRTGRIEDKIAYASFKAELGI
jgi:hypothetical protein